MSDDWKCSDEYSRYYNMAWWHVAFILLIPTLILGCAGFVIVWKVIA
jgi:hypothetical protein